ncbi:hypothetical protein BJF78_05390 [Pseudonocardia sp. CNS-139]|nr:hypothetical protein BJF78_05390 [Pseudonocardia sp. CNS-139]
MIYFDTSALLKLVRKEPGSDELVTYIGDRTDFLSSKLLVVESRRGVLREDVGMLPRVDLFLSRIDTISISDAIIESASRLTDRHLRSLDAIHIATALVVREEIEVLLSYDKRLLAVAEAHGIPTAAPA